MISVDEHLGNVGRLFYAIAICDGNLHDQELETLRNTLEAYRDILITKSSLKDPSRIQSTEQIIAMVSGESMDSWAYFTKFKNYFELHKEEFSRETKDRILSGINRIASSFAKQNKSEIVLFAKTSLLFNAV